jgi:hypothetical protein
LSKSIVSTFASHKQTCANFFFYLLFHKSSFTHPNETIDLDWFCPSLELKETQKKEFHFVTGTPFQLQTVSKETLLRFPKLVFSQIDINRSIVIFLHNLAGHRHSILSKFRTRLSPLSVFWVPKPGFFSVITPREVPEGRLNWDCIYGRLLSYIFFSYKGHYGFTRLKQLLNSSRLRSNWQIKLWFWFH